MLKEKSQTMIKTYYDIAKLVIWGDQNSESDNKRPRLVFGFRDGNPRLTVYTGAQGPGGVISFPTDHPTMVAIMTMMQDVVAGEPGIKFSIDSLTSVYENNLPTKEKKVVSTLYIGKSKEGIVYLSVISEGKPKLVFSIKPSQYHSFRDKDKNVIPDNIISCKLATGIVNTVLSIISTALVNYTEQEYQTVRKPVPIKGGQQNSSNSQTTDIVSDLDDLNL